MRRAARHPRGRSSGSRSSSSRWRRRRSPALAVARDRAARYRLPMPKARFWHGRGTLAAVARPAADRVVDRPLAAAAGRAAPADHPCRPRRPARRMRTSSRDRDAAALRDVDVVLPANRSTAFSPRAGIRVDGEARVVAPDARVGAARRSRAARASTGGTRNSRSPASAPIGLGHRHRDALGRGRPSRRSARPTKAATSKSAAISR